MEGSLGVRKGAWSRVEDDLLRACVERYGEGKWHLVPIRAGLKRCRKSCRLRWLNYLKPSIKRGGFCEDEVDLMIRLHRLLGNRWSLIAGRLPGRTPNDVKNYWNTHHVRKTNKKSLAKRVLLQEDHHTNNNNNAIIIKKGMPSGSNSVRPSHQVIRPQPRTFSKKSTACGGKEEEGGMLLMTESGGTATCYNNNNSLFCEQDWNLNYWDTNGHDDEFEEEQGIIINKQDGLAEDNNHFLIEAHPSWSDDILLDINLWDYIHDE